VAISSSRIVHAYNKWVAMNCRLSVLALPELIFAGPLEVALCPALSVRRWERVLPNRTNTLKLAGVSPREPTT